MQRQGSAPGVLQRVLSRQPLGRAQGKQALQQVKAFVRQRARGLDQADGPRELLSQTVGEDSGPVHLQGACTVNVRAC